MAEIAGQAVASGSAIYEMTTGGPGTWTMDRAHDAANAQSKVQDEINQEIAQIAHEISGGWTGKAADGAHSATQPLADGALRSSQALHAARNVHATQGQHFSHTSTSVVPVADSPPETGLWDSVTPWDTDTEDAVNNYIAGSQRNADLYRAYGDTSRASDAAMPREYPRFPDFHGVFTVAPNKRGPAGDPSERPADTIGGGGSTTTAGYSGGPSADGFAYPPASGGQPVPGGGQPALGGGSQQPVAGPGATMGSGPNGGQAPTGTGTGAGAAGGVPRNGFGPGIGAAGLIGGATGAGLGGESVRSGRGFGTGVRGGSTTGAVDGGSGARGGAAGRVTAGTPGQPPGTGGKTGVGPGAAAAAEAAAARGTAGGAGGRGPAGGPMGAGRGKGGEDREHQRKTVLVEPDEEGTFGTDQLTAPPVIGGDLGHQQ
ncbi:MAG: hypothetical protein ACRDQ5_10745 [Sciscionella sp.]